MLGRLIVVAAALCGYSLALGGSATAAEVDGFAGPRVLVHFAPTATPDQRASALRSVDGAVDAVIPEIGITRIALRAGARTADAVSALEGEDGVGSAEIDETVRLRFTPNDSFYLRDPYTGLGQWGLRIASVDRAWDVVRGSPQIVVAVVDTGVDPGHPDLAGALLPGVTFESAPSTGCQVQPNALDDNSHGTHVSGIIAAAGNNTIGIAGVAFGVKVLPIKALDCTGAGTTSDVAQGIIYATDHGARIINISLGSPAPSPTVQSAVLYAQNHNVLVVAAAGNCGVSGPECTALNEPDYPAAYPGVLAVGATDSTDAHASFSTQAPYLGVSAPGVRIISTTPTYPTYQSARGATQSYGVFSGTSQASPFVAGVAALLLSQNPALSASQLANQIEQTADPLGGTVPNSLFGTGRVNAFRAVSGGGTTPVVPPPAGAAYGATYAPALSGASLVSGTTTTLNVTVTNTGTFSWAAGGTNPVHLSYHWLNSDRSVAVWEGARGTFASDVLPGKSATVALALVPPPTLGTYVLRLDLVQEGITWFSGQGVSAADLAFTVTNGFLASLAVGGVPAVLPGGRVSLPVTIKNDGVSAWSAAGLNPVHAAAHLFDARGNVIVWDGARTVFAQDVPAGAAFASQVTIDAPQAGGTYRAHADLVREGIGWFGAGGASDALLLVLPDYRATLPGGPLTVSRASPVAQVTVANSSSALWSASAANPVELSVHWLDAQAGVLIWDGPRTKLARDMAPGDSATLTVSLGPVPTGAASVVIDVLSEGIQWFGAGAARPVTLTP